MAEIKVYCYEKCGTCRKALKWLNDRGISYREIAIRETPPSIDNLKKAFKAEGSIRRIINTSSKDYRDLGLKDKLTAMPVDEVLSLLRKNGNLVKRPFVVAKGTAWAGFKPEIWEQRLP